MVNVYLMFILPTRGTTEFLTAVQLLSENLFGISLNLVHLVHLVHLVPIFLAVFARMVVTVSQVLRVD
jgi:hypothetical protein